MRGLTLFALFCLTLPTWAAQRPLIAKDSAIQFQFSQMNVPAEGRFKRFTAQVDFDPAHLDAAKVSLQVPVASFDFGPEVDAEVAKPDWLDSAKFPTATFESQSVKALGGDKFEASGTLTIKGVSKDIVVPFTYRSTTPERAEVSGTFAIQRTRYGVGGGMWGDVDVVADAVQIRFRLVLGPGVKSTASRQKRP